MKLNRQTMAAVVFAAVLCSVTAGCGGSRHEAGPKTALLVAPAGTVPVTAVPQGQEVNVTLPVDAYLKSPDQVAVLDKAQAILTAKCMKRYGFDFPVADFSHEASVPRNAFRYGPTTAQQADSGYRWRTQQDSASGTAVPSMSQAEQSVFTGKAAAGGAVNGVKVPDGGCSGEAKHRLEADGGALDDAAIAQRIDGSYASSQATPQVQAVFKAWSGCMHGFGYAYDTPLDPMKDHTLMGSPTPVLVTSSGAPPGAISMADPPLGAAEIAVAHHDVECKQQTNLVGVWSSVEAAMQKQAIDQHSEELGQAKAAIDKTMRNAAAVLASGQ